MDQAETQVFLPIRQDFDEKVNVELIQAEFGIFDWKIKTRGNPIGDREQLYKALGMAGRTGGPTLNEMLQIENEIFNTDFRMKHSKFYDQLSAAEAIGMVRQGLITYDPETWEPKPVAGGGAAPPKIGGQNEGMEPDTENMDENNQTRQGQGRPTETAQKGSIDDIDTERRLMAVTDVITLLGSLRAVEKADIDRPQRRGLWARMTGRQ